jgi:RNA-directed DNA polymerase
VRAAQLRGLGVALTPPTTRLPHTLQVEAGEAGCDCLGCHMRPYPTTSTRGDTTIIPPSREAMARHQRQRRAGVRRPRMDPQARVSEAVNPGIRGGSPDGSTGGRHATCAQRDEPRRPQRRSWIRCRHPPKRRKGGDPQDWGGEDGRRNGRPRAWGQRWWCHPETPMPRHVNGHGRRRPDEGDAVDGGRRRAHHSGLSTRVARLLRRQDGRCPPGGDAFNAGDGLEVDPRMPRIPGGSDESTNWPRRHRYGHREKTARERRRDAWQTPHV